MSSYLNGIFRKIAATATSSASSTPISGLTQDPDDPERGEYKGRVVSIFCPASVVLVKRLKTLKHPNIIQYIIDSHDNTSGSTTHSNNSIWLVTEPVKPLDINVVVEHKDWAVLVAWQAASALLFLNKQAGIAHCNLQNTAASMFMDDTGMFKLGGLEASLSKRDAQEGDRLARMVGCGSISDLSDALLANIDQPRLLCFIQNNLRVGNNLTSLEQFTSEFESHRLVQLVTRLDSLHIDIDLDRMATIKAAAVFCQSPSCPKPLIFKVLLSIFGALQNTEIPMDTVRLLFDCLTRLLDNTDSAVKIYQKRCLEIYANLLSTCKDRNVRLMLIEGVERAMGMVGDQFCQSTIYPFLTSSLSDSANATIRDAALRTLISMATRNHLQPNTVSGDLLRHLARLQDDPQAGIRANLLIGLGKLDPILPEDVRSKVIGPAYCRGLTDPFAPSKVAALSGLIESGRSCSRQEIATRLLPHICPLMVDENVEIAGRAVAVVDIFMSTIKEHTKPWKSPAMKAATVSDIEQQPRKPSYTVNQEQSQCEQMMKEMSIQPQQQTHNPKVPEEIVYSTPAEPTIKPQPGRGRLGATRKLQ